MNSAYELVVFHKKLYEKKLFYANKNHIFENY